MKCQISWIDPRGKPTPDENEAVGFVRREAHTYVFAGALNDQITLTQTEWIPICQEHTNRLPIPNWSFKLIYEVSP